VERYRQHHPDATGDDVCTAAQLSLPMTTEQAYALTGRPPPAPGADRADHRLHPDGTGIFVLVPLQESGELYVGTYLRLDGAEQRRLARAWFLDTLPLLRSAFEMGFRAAREPGAPQIAERASEAARHALAALAPRLAVAAGDARAQAPVAPRSAPPAPKAVTVPPDVHLEAAHGWRITGWGTRAKQDAAAAGLSEIPAQYLTELEVMTPAALAEVVAAAGWVLHAKGSYGGLRTGAQVLLLRRMGPADPATVIRCHRLDDPG